MKLYDNIIPKLLKGNISDVVAGQLNTGQPYLKRLYLFDELNQQSQNNEAYIISALSEGDCFVTDKMCDAQTNVIDAYTDYTGEISSEFAHNVYDTFKALRDKEISDDNQSGAITITDVNGNIYNFVTYDEPGCHIPNSNLYGMVCTCLQPKSLYDTLVYFDQSQNKYFCNPVVRSANFNIDVYDQEMTSIFDGLLDIAYIVGCDVRSDIEAIVIDLMDFLDIPTNSLTINGRIGDWYDYVLPHGAEFSDIYTKLYRIHGYYKHEFASNKQGSVSMIQDLLAQLIESEAINDCLHQMAKICLAGHAAIEQVQNLYNTVTNKFESVRNCLKGGIEAFRTGGVVALAYYILNYGKSLTTTISSEGRLQFTDNAGLTPGEYLVGILSGIVTVVGTAASLIVSIFSRVAGAALSILTPVVQSAISSIAYNYDTDTNARLNTNEDVFLDAAPMGICQSIIHRGRLSPALCSQIDEQLADQAVLIIEIPGGYFFLGKGPSDSDGYAMEFHPSIIDHRSLYSQMISSYQIDAQILGYNHDLCDHINLTTSGFERLLNSYSSSADVSTLQNYQSESAGTSVITLNSTDDLAVREIILCNISLAMMYLNYLNGTSTWLSGNYARAFYDYTTDKFSRASGADFDIQYLHSYQLAYYYELYRLGYISDISWQKILTNCTNLQSEYTGTLPIEFEALCNGGFIRRTFTDMNFIGSPIKVYGSDFAYALLVPKYNRSTYWMYIALGVAVAAVAAVGTIIASVKIKNWKRSIAARNSAQCEAAWEAVKANPDDPDVYKSYVKAVKKNNMSTLITGGTKWNKEGFWASTDTGNTEIAQADSNTMTKMIAATSLFGDNDKDISPYETLNSIRSLIIG